MSTRKDLRSHARRFLNASQCIALLLTALGVIMTPRAQAATQEFRGCVNVEDTLDSPETPALVGVAGIPIEVEYEALGIFLPGVGSLSTNDSGCFSATLSGFTVPRETRIRLTAKLKDSRQGVANDAGDTYKIELDTRSAVEGTREDFGDIDFTLANSSDATHGAILMWHAVNRAVETYQSRVGTWDFSNRLWIYFPADQDTATGGDNGLRIPLVKRDNLSGTFFHELGHFISDSDVSRDGDRESYCAVKGPGAYPADRSPYTYRNEDEQVPDADCGHSFGSYEYQTRAVAEGFADAVSDFLADGICQNGKGVAELGFDKSNSELNIMKFVCRSMDSGDHSSSALHTYGQNQDHLHILEGASYSAVPYIDDSLIYLAEGKAIYQLDLKQAISSGSSAPELLHQFVSPSISKVNELFRLGVKLCALVTTPSGQKEIHCRGGVFGSKSTGPGKVNPAGLAASPFAFTRVSPVPVSSSMPASAFDSMSRPVTPDVVASDAFLELSAASLPHDSLSGGYLVDVYARPDRLYLLYRVYTPQGPRLNAYYADFDPESPSLGFSREGWTQLFEIDVGAASFSQLAVDASASRLFVSNSNSIYSCSLTRGCSVLSLWAGSLTQIGYRRGTRLNSILGWIGNLQVAGDDLYITDHYGVSRSSFGSGAPDEVVQVVGTGGDPVFENNLSLRSLQFFGPASFSAGFYVDDNWLVASGVYAPYNERRGGLSVREALFLADRSIPVVSQVYCGTEKVSANARKVIRLYQSAPHFYMNASEFESVFKSSTGVSSTDVSALKKHSWLSLSSSGCTLQGGDIRDYEITAGSSRYSEGKLGSAASILDAAGFGKWIQDQEERAEKIREYRLTDIMKRAAERESRSRSECGGSNIKRELPREDAVLKNPLKRSSRAGVPEKKFKRPERRFSKPVPLLEVAKATLKTPLQGK